MTTPRFNRIRMVPCVFAVACCAAVVGCEKRSEGPDANLSPAARSNLEATLAAYEDLRSALAHDDTSELPALASRLAKAADEAGEASPQSLRPALNSLSASARALGKADPDDIAAARSAFAEVSRQSVAILEADGSLRQGRRVYECTMTEGYGKWIQTADSVENPYQGSKMLRCGTEVDW